LISKLIKVILAAELEKTIWRKIKDIKQVDIVHPPEEGGGCEKVKSGQD